MLSVIIVNYKTPEFLRLCLRSLFSHAWLNPLEVIVIDSETSRVTQDVVLEEFPSVTLIPVKGNTGYARGVNIGLRKAKGEYLLIINPDIIVTENSLDKLVDFLRSRPDVGLAGPRLLHFDGSFQDSCRRFYTPLTVLTRRTFLGAIPPFKKINDQFLMKDSNRNTTQDVDWLMGSALITTKQALEKTGSMDERYMMYFEDMDFARSFWKNGYRVVYYPEATFYHYYPRESKSELGIFDAFFNQKTRWHIQSAMKYFWKWRKELTLRA